MVLHYGIGTKQVTGWISAQLSFRTPPPDAKNPPNDELALLVSQLELRPPLVHDVAIEAIPLTSYGLTQDSGSSMKAEESQENVSISFVVAARPPIASHSLFHSAVEIMPSVVAVETVS